MRFALLLGPLLLGCGSTPPPPTFPVHGTVHYAGGSLADGRILLHSSNSERLVHGFIEKDQSFILKTVLKGQNLEGVEPGIYEVEILPPPSTDMNVPLLQSKNRKVTVEEKENQLKIEVIDR